MLDRVKTISDLAMYVGYPTETVRKLNPAEQYITFEIPKPGKQEKRTIEAPTGMLMEILERMNYSIWIGSFDPARRETLNERILELLRLPQAEDSKLFVLPIKRCDLKRMRSLNGCKPENLDYWLGDLKTMFC